MNLGQLLKKFGKNLLAGLIGAVMGVIIFVIYLFKFWLPANAEKMGLGIIAFIPIMLILFSVMGIFIGGISGIVIYHIIRSFRKKHLILFKCT